MYIIKDALLNISEYGSPTRSPQRDMDLSQQRGASATLRTFKIFLWKFSIARIFHLFL